MSNKNFNDLSKEELIDILNQDNLSEEESVELFEALKAKGLGGSIMAVDSPDSEEVYRVSQKNSRELLFKYA